MAVSQAVAEAVSKRVRIERLRELITNERIRPWLMLMVIAPDGRGVCGSIQQLSPCRIQVRWEMWAATALRVRGPGLSTWGCLEHSHFARANDWNFAPRRTTS